MTTVANDRVVNEHEIKFPYEEPVRFENTNAYLLQYLHCAVHNINENMVVLHGGGYVDAQKPDWYQWSIDEFRFVLYNDTILKVDLNYVPLQAFCDSLDPAEQSQPDPGSSNPGGGGGDPGDPNPNSTPSNPNPDNIPLSQPYDPNTNDRGHSGAKIPPSTELVLITMFGQANNQYNQLVAVDTKQYTPDWEIAPYSNAPFTLVKGITFRDNLAEWDVVGKDGTHYGCGVYAWYGTPQFRVEPYGQNT